MRARLYVCVYVMFSLWFVKHNSLKTFVELHLHSFLIATPGALSGQLYSQVALPAEVNSPVG